MTPMTIESIRAIMKVSPEQMGQILSAAGLPNDPEKVLSDQEVKKLRLAILRCHQTPPAPAKPEPAAEVQAAPPEPETQQETQPEPEAWDGPVDPQMEQLVLEKKIMIDTCTLMDDRCGDLMDRLLPALQKHRKQVLIPVKVIHELQRHQNSSNPGKAMAAERGLCFCSQLQKAQCLSIRGEQRDHFADNTFFVALSRYRYQYHMLLITQDRKLSQDVLQLNRMQSSQGYPVEVMYLNKFGQLCPSGTF